MCYPGGVLYFLGDPFFKSTFVKNQEYPYTRADRGIGNIENRLKKAEGFAA